MKRSASVKLSPFAKVIQNQRYNWALGLLIPDAMTRHCPLKSKYLHVVGWIIHVTCCLEIVAGMSVIPNRNPVASEQHV